MRRATHSPVSRPSPAPLAGEAAILARLDRMEAMLRRLAATSGVAVHQCPICGDWTSGWKKAGNGRNKMYCPTCTSKPRHRMIWLWLDRMAAAGHRAPRAILHVGPEPCLARLRRRARGIYVGSDISASRPGVTHCLSIEDIPFADGVFDLIVCNHVLEHVGDDRRAMAEFHRVLAPGGSALLTVPIDTARFTTYEDPTITDPDSRAAHFGQFDHVRLYGRDFPRRLAGSGLRVTAFRARDLPAAEIELYGLRRKETLYVGSKDAGPGGSQ